jgi:uroporphyrinogen-III synthase
VLCTALAEAGIEMVRLVTYTTVEHTELAARLNTLHNVDVLVFFSPSGLFFLLIFKPTDARNIRKYD